MLGFRHVLPSSPNELVADRSLVRPAAVDGVDAVGSAVGIGNDLPLAHSEIATAAAYEALSVPAGDLVANGRVSKFLVDLRDPAQPVVFFVNGNFRRDGTIPDEAKFHFDFARAVLEHSGTARGIQSPDLLQPDQEIRRRCVAHLPAGRHGRTDLRPAVLPAGRDPRAGCRRRRHRGEGQDQHPGRQVRLRADRIPADHGDGPGSARGRRDRGADHRPDPRLDHLPAAQRRARRGDSCGSSRPDDACTPTDIPVFDELPLDLSVVAGVITRAVQDTNSHVNLKSKERGTPNMVLRDAGPGNPRLAPFARPTGAPRRAVRRLHSSNRPPTRSSQRSSPSGTTSRGSR